MRPHFTPSREAPPRQPDVLWRDLVQAAPDLARFAAILRRAGERLQQEFGKAAHEILDSALADALRIVDGLTDGRKACCTSRGASGACGF